MGGEIAIGPFALHAPIGRGGMGAVFRGVHAPTGTPVAIKVLLAERALGERYVAAFRREAERLAALDHPAIVTVLDHGTLPEEVDGPSGGALTPGSPYLVMELAEGGSLESRAPLPFPDVVRILRVLLDALAHAHARGVVHRDIKPANVLLSGCEDGSRAEVLLTDFGIAHALDDDERELPSEREGVIGTPGFMAPEQVRGEWRDLGPWTDLYALGCLAWSLLAGGAPFRGDTPHRILFAQLTAGLPPLPPGAEVPEAAAAWLARLGALDPRDRFTRAADAAAELEVIAAPLRSVSLPATSIPSRGSRPRSGVVLGGAPEASIAPTLESMRTRVRTTADTRALGDAGERTTIRAEAPPAPPPEPGPASSRAQPSTKPPFPRTWRAASAAPPRMQLVGAGLSLYGAREVPLSDRERERDALWSALGEVRASGGTRIVVLRGASGVGKSRLLRWMLHRTHELGIATTILATHGPERGPRDGIAPALARHLGCVRLGAERLRARVRRILEAQGASSELEAEGLFAALASAGCTDPVPRGTEREAAAAALERALLREARERPLVLGLDDLQWGDESVRQIASLAEAGGGPVLVVATVQEEALLVAPETRARITALERAPGASIVPVGPLGPEDHLRLVEDLLRLEPPLARELVRRTAGNPLFAEQLVGDWVRRGILEVRGEGFALRAGASIDLPDDLHAVWIARVDRLLDGRPSADREALELAALLGHRTDAAEWDRACELAHRPSPRGLTEALARARLVERDRDAIAFVHGMLRESVVRRCRESGALAARTAVLEAMLRERVAAGHAEARERLGRLLADHGRPLEAAPLFVEAAEQRRVQAEYGTALALGEEAESCFDRAGMAADDPARGPGWIVRSWTLRNAGAYAGAVALAERVLALRDRDGFAALVPAALLRRADVDARTGDVERARKDLAIAREQLVARGDLRGIVGCDWLGAWIDVFRGELDAPLESLARMRVLSEMPGAFATGSLHVLWTAGYVRLAREEPDAAEALYRLAEASATRLSNRLGLAHARFGHASVALLRGENDRAIELAHEAIDLYASFGSSESHFAELALALALRRAGRHDEADRVIAAAIATLARTGRSGFAARLDTVRAGIDAALGRWDAMRARLLEAGPIARAHGHRETIIARELLEAAAAAEGAGRGEAGLAIELALHHLDKPHTRAEHDALAARAR